MSKKYSYPLTQNNLCASIQFIVCLFLFFKNKFYLFIYLFIYLWLCWVFVAARRLSLVVVSGSCSLLWCAGFSLRWLLLLQSTGSRRTGFSSCGMRAQQLRLAGSRAQTQQLWHTGLVAPRHVGSSWTRNQTCDPCIGRRILNRCTTRAAQAFSSKDVHCNIIYEKKLETT